MKRNLCKRKKIGGEAGKHRKGVVLKDKLARNKEKAETKMKTNNGLAKHFSRLDNKTQAKKNSRGQRQISNKTKSREMTLGTTPFLSHACVHKKRSTCTWGRIGEGNSFPSVRRHRNRLRLELLYFLQSSTAGNRGSTQLWENNLRSVPIWRLGAAVSEFKHHSRLLLRGRRLQK